MTGAGADFFDDIYHLTDADETAAHYAKFAQEYEDAMAGNGYATPQRCAEALAAAGLAKDAPILDIGCGSGLSGAALRAAGFTTIDGTDFSPEMLALAKAKGIYRTLSQQDLRSFAGGSAYAAITAVGVLNPAHAPATVIDEALAALGPGGILVFSLNDHAIADGTYEGRVHEIIDTGFAHLLHREYGAHMPGQDLQSWVLALQKA